MSTKSKEIFQDMWVEVYDNHPLFTCGRKLDGFNRLTIQIKIGQSFLIFVEIHGCIGLLVHDSRQAVRKIRELVNSLGDTILYSHNILHYLAKERIEMYDTHCWKILIKSKTQLDFFQGLKPFML